MNVSGISITNMPDNFFQLSGTKNNFLSGSGSIGFGFPALDGSEDESSNTIGADLNVLLEALESGNLSTAQTSLSRLLVDLQSTGSTDSSSSSTALTSGAGADSNPLAKDLSALEDAISSGDLTGAQSILANIMQHMQGPPPPPPEMNTNTDPAIETESNSSSSALADDLKALGEALSSGDQAGATSYFSQLLQDLEDAGSANSLSSSTAATEATSSQYNMLLQNFLQILASLTSVNSQSGSTSTVA